MSLTVLRHGGQPLAVDTAPLDGLDVIDDRTGARAGSIWPTPHTAVKPLAAICAVCYAGEHADTQALALAWLEQHRRREHL